MQKLLNKHIFIILGIIFSWFVLMPLVLSELSILVCNNLSHNSQYNIEIIKPKIYLSILPNAVYKAQSLKIQNKKTKNTLEINNFKLKARLLPLLSGNLHINYITVDELKLSTKFDNNIELDKDFFNKLKTSKIKIDSLQINKYDTKIYQKNLKQPIKYYGENLLYQTKNRYVKFHLKSSLILKDKISNTYINLLIPKNNDIKKTVFDIDIDNLDLESLRVYFKHYLPKDLIKMTGEINVKANKNELITHLNNCSAIFEDSAKSIIFPKILQIKSKFFINRKFILLESVDVKSKNIDITFDGKISNYFGKSMPTLNLNFRINNSKLEDVINMLPPFNTEELNAYKLKKYKAYGNILSNFSIKGRLPEPEIIGDLYLSDLVVLKPIPNTNKGASVKIKLIGKYINFDVNVPAGGKEKVIVNGTQEIYNIKFAELSVKTTETVNLHSVQNVLNPLHEILNFIIGPLPIMELYGYGNADILVKGNRKNPHIWGVINAKNVNANFLEIPDMIATEQDITLTLNDQNIVFQNSSGKLNGKDLKINGYSDLFGKFDFSLTTKDQPSALIYNSVKKSKLLQDIANTLPPLTSVDGKIDLDLKVFGSVDKLSNIKLNKNVFTKGLVNFKNNICIIENILINNINGFIKYDNNNAEYSFNANIGEDLLTAKANVKNNIVDFIFNIPKLNSNSLISDDNLKTKKYLPIISANGKYKGDINKIDYKKVNINAKVLSSDPLSKIKYNAGDITIANGKINLKNLKGYINNVQNAFEINLKIDNAFDENSNYNGNIKLKTPDLSFYNEIFVSDILPAKFKNYLKDIEFKNGSLDFNCKIFNNIINAYLDLSGINLNYRPYNLPISIINGNLAVKNNTLKLNKINLLADNMPILVDGDIKDIFDKQNFNIYVNSKPKQEFIDKYINKNQLYPLKIKGDIVYWTRLKGLKNNYEIKSNVDLSKNASIYYLGATVGDIENALEINLDTKVINNKILKIKEFSYDKVIDSQNGKRTNLNMLKAFGGIEVLKDDLSFNDFKIKTSNPTDARIFNIIFRKPNIKQGQFISDLKFNNKLSNPKVLGDFHIFETDIPFFDTTMKNIVLVFKDKTINISSKGEVIGNEVLFDGILKNKLTTPYYLENGILYTKNLDLNRIVEKLKISEVDNVSTFESFEDFDLNNIVFKNLKFKADNIELRNIRATNYEAITSLDEKGLFSVDSFIFNIANGSLKGKYNYNLKTNDMNLNLTADSINANDITWALFDLNNQIYGDLTGKIDLSCNGTNFQHCMQTLNGNTLFNVKNGNMPKLGSLEYLLKASNLVKGGFTGLSINSVIDLLSPLKTGSFSDIFGSVRIKDGVARNIEITTKGESLSLFMSGTYNFATSIAEMEILGLLSRKISTMFGPIGNMSINTLFNVIPGVDLSKDSTILEKINKIPGVELSNKIYRKFVADIKGNINGEDYVTSFKWIN